MIGAIKTKRVEKIGYVISNSWDDYQKYSVKIKVEWIKGFSPIEAPRNIFNDDLEIERINKDMVSLIGLPFRFMKEINLKILTKDDKGYVPRDTE